MKPVNYIIRIPEPCHEDWNKMKPDEKGKFCGSCCKSVVDFSNKTDLEIQNILLENKDQKVCGHFKKTQIDRPLNISFDLKNLPKNISSTKAFAIALFLVFGTLLFSCTDEKNKTIGAIEVTNSLKEQEEVHTVGMMLIMPDSIIAEPLPEIDTVDGEIVCTETFVNGGLSMETVPAIKDTVYTADTTTANDIRVISEKQSELTTLGMMVVQLTPEDTTGTSALNDSVAQKNTLTQIRNEIPPKTTDLSVFPNPSNGEFIIKYDVTKRADVRVDIYDLKGTLIRNVVNTAGQYEGKYQIPVNLNELPSGIYIVDLTNNGKRFTEKVVIGK